MVEVVLGLIGKLPRLTESAYEFSILLVPLNSTIGINSSFVREVVNFISRVVIADLGRGDSSLLRDNGDASLPSGDSRSCKVMGNWVIG